MKKYNIYFLKLQKAASTTIARHLEEYARNNDLIYNNGYFEQFFRKHKFNIITNHTLYNQRYLNHFYQSIDPDLETFRLVCLRNPIERAESHYYSWRFQKQANFNCNFSEFVIRREQKHNLKWPEPHYGETENNFYTKYLNLNSKNLECIFNKFDDFIIYEHFNECLEKLEQKLEFQFDKSLVVNKTQKKPSIKITDEAKEILIKNNQEDLKLYSLINQHLGYEKKQRKWWEFWK